MILSVHQPQYIPWLGYFDKIARSDAFVFLDCVQYKAREYQNRNRIRRKGGSMWLTVPVVSNGRQPIREVL
ncbi:MAG: WbqC family protein, partial [Deltaproteobacteria bacterium]